MRRKKLPPDTRPKWDDPDLKVSALHGRVYTPEQWQELMRRSHRQEDHVMKPHWRSDPAYFWAKKKKKSV